MVFEESIHRIGGYVSGNIATSIIAGVAAYLFLRIFSVPSPPPSGCGWGSPT